MTVANMEEGGRLIRPRSKWSLCLSPEKYIERVIKRFQMTNAKSVSNHLALQMKLFRMDALALRRIMITCHRFHILMQWGASCMQWCVLNPILLKRSVM